MERKAFLKNGIMAALGLAAVTPLVSSCNKNELTGTSESGSGSDSGTSSGSCSVSPTETAGPFPTKSPSSLVTNDIRSDRAGIPFTIKITVNNRNSNCAALAQRIRKPR